MTPHNLAHFLTNPPTIVTPLLPRPYYCRHKSLDPSPQDRDVSFGRPQMKISFQTELRLSKSIEGGSLLKFLEIYSDEKELRDESVEAFRRIHESGNYQSELKIVANLVFGQSSCLSKKFAKTFYEFECDYHSQKSDCVHLCIKQHLVKHLSRVATSNFDFCVFWCWVKNFLSKINCSPVYIYLVLAYSVCKVNVVDLCLNKQYIFLLHTSLRPFEGLSI